MISAGGYYLRWNAVCGESRMHGVKWGKTARTGNADGVRYLSLFPGPSDVDCNTKRRADGGGKPWGFFGY